LSPEYGNRNDDHVLHGLPNQDRWQQFGGRGIIKKAGQR
jgi:hypothetical protein